jgi:hypothetical protein
MVLGGVVGLSSGGASSTTSTGFGVESAMMYEAGAVRKCTAYCRIARAFVPQPDRQAHALGLYL